MRGLLARLLRLLALGVHLFICRSFFFWLQLLEFLINSSSSSFFWRSSLRVLYYLVILNPQFFLLLIHERLHDVFNFQLIQLTVNLLLLFKTYPFWFFRRILNRIRDVILCDDMFDLRFLQKWKILCNKVIRIFWLQIYQFVTSFDVGLKQRIIFTSF